MKAELNKLLSLGSAWSRTDKQMELRTKVVLLGTGTPVPDPERSGPATAIVVAEEATASLRASRWEVVR